MRASRPALCILSPHPDDAVFSLGLALQTWYARGLPLSVVTVYTRSVYAPRRPSARGSIAKVSAVRAHEDREAFRRIGPQIANRDLRRQDAPVRLSCPTERVFAFHEQVADEAEVRKLTPILQRRLRNSLVLAPLGLGDHIDHATVRNAALAAAGQTTTGPARLGFYEDLPYADWTPAASLHETVAVCESVLHTRLTPAIVRNKGAVPSKRQLAQTYSSQIDPREAQRIARYSLRYHGGERIWIPTSSRHWRIPVMP